MRFCATNECFHDEDVNDKKGQISQISRSNVEFRNSIKSLTFRVKSISVTFMRLRV